MQERESGLGGGSPKVFIYNLPILDKNWSLHFVNFLDAGSMPREPLFVIGNGMYLYVSVLSLCYYTGSFQLPMFRVHIICTT